MNIVNGTRWHKCDLHLHTPASKCFTDKTIHPKDWVQKAIDEGLSCVAVTDHNTGEWIDKIKEASKETSLTIFPGVEITCSDAKVHMLILFDVDKKTTDIEDFLIQAGIPRSDFGEVNAHTSKNLEDITVLAKRCGALVIPAHIDEFNGISNAAYQIREKLFKNEHINAVQLVHPEFLKTSPSEEEKRALKDKLMMYYSTDISEDRIKNYYSTVNQAVENGQAILTFSDNPHAPGDSRHGTYGIGTRYTWIKMDKAPNLEGLRQAFLLHSLRINADFESPHAPYETPDLWLESVSICNSEITGKDKVQYDFSPQMTTIIGGRGTGKSSVIKLLRGVFGKDKDLNTFSTLLSEHSDFFRLKNNKNKKGILKSDTKIEVIFIRNKNRYKITATEFNEEIKNKDISKRHKFNIEKWDEKKKTYQLIPDNVEDFIDFFDFNMFSQRQIYEVAQTPNALRDMIDGSIKGLDKLKKRGEEISAKYCEYCLKIRRLTTLIKEKSKYETSLNDVVEQISSYQNSGVTELIKKREKFNLDIEKIFRLVTKDLKEKENLLKDITEEFSINQYDTDRLNDKYKPEIGETISCIYSELVVIKEGLEKFKLKITKLQSTSREQFAKSIWTRDYKDLEKEFEQKKMELKDKGILDLENIEKLIQKREEITDELEKISSSEKELEKLKIEKNHLKKDFIDIRRKITQQRREFLNGVLDVDFVKIDVIPFRDSQHYELEFRNIINKDDNFVNEIENIIEEIFFNGKVETQVSKVIQKISNIKYKPEASNNFGTRFRSMIQKLSDEQIDRLEILMPEDEIKVSYKQNNSAKWKPLSNASAGQKTSAILAFILSHGSNPLILDQPEDDMDNYVIYELIVKKLADTKNKRQVIVATHNANIPVNGDSEYVIIMDSESKEVKVLTAGTVENDKIKNEICSIMEGGEKAFQMRSHRYHL